LEVLELARAALKKSLGADHPDTLVAANNLAGAYRDTGKIPEAIALFREVHQKRADLLGAEHEDTLTTLNNLAVAYQEAGRLPEAIAAFDVCRKAYLKNLPRDHPQLLIVTVNLAVALHKSGKPQDAMTLLEEAAPLVEKRKFQPAASAPVIVSLIRIYDEQERYADAETWRVKWLGYLKSTRGERSMEVVIETFNLAECRGNQSNWREAEATYRECAALLAKVKPELWSADLIQAKIGESLYRQKKYAEAEPLLLKGYEGLKMQEKQIPPSQKHRLPEVAGLLRDLYKAWDKPDDAKKWIEERNKYPFTTW
jgi:tetratricopeptide (TPR) repeat protein